MLFVLLAPLSVAASVLKRDGAVMIAASLLLVAVILLDALFRAVGVSFLVLLLAYVTSILIFARSAPVERDIPAPAKSQPTFVSVLAILGGLVLTIISARMLIAGATNLPPKNWVCPNLLSALPSLLSVPLCRNW